MGLIFQFMAINEKPNKLATLTVMISTIFNPFKYFSWNHYTVELNSKNSSFSTNINLTDILGLIFYSTYVCTYIIDYFHKNYGNSLSRIFGKNFVKVTVLLNKLLKSWLDEIFLWWERISRFSTLCCGKVLHSGIYGILLSKFFRKNSVKLKFY